MQRKVLVTGGAGFIGSALCRRLVGDGVSVLNIDALTYAGNLQSLAAIGNAPNYRFAKIDICDRRALTEAFETFAPDQVIHLAAESHVDRSIMAGDAFIQTNIVGTFSPAGDRAGLLARAAGPRRDGFRFLHVSTDEVYGSLGEDGRIRGRDAPTIRVRPIRPPRPPPIIWCRAWARTYGLPALITNCSNNYGPYQFPEKLIPWSSSTRIARQADAGLWRRRECARLAVCRGPRRALDLMSRAAGSARNTTSAAATSAATSKSCMRICAILDRLRPLAPLARILIAFVADRPGHDRRYAIDATKLERELGWRALETFESGIEKTVRWYLDNEWWWRPLRDKVYAGERLGVIAEALAGVNLVAQRAPPPFVVEIPAHRLARARLEDLARPPAEFALDLGRVDGVAQVVRRAGRRRRR